MRDRCGWTGVTLRCIQDVCAEEHDGWRHGWVSAVSICVGGRGITYRDVKYI